MSLLTVFNTNFVYEGGSMYKSILFVALFSLFAYMPLVPLEAGHGGGGGGHGGGGGGHFGGGGGHFSGGNFGGHGWHGGDRDWGNRWNNWDGGGAYFYGGGSYPYYSYYDDPYYDSYYNNSYPYYGDGLGVNIGGVGLGFGW